MIKDAVTIDSVCVEAIRELLGETHDTNNIQTLTLIFVQYSESCSLNEAPHCILRLSRDEVSDVNNGVKAQSKNNPRKATHQQTYPA